MKKTILFSVLALLAMYGCLGWISQGEGMTQIFAITELKRFTSQMTAAMFVVIMARFMDHLNGSKFKEWHSEADSMSKAVYNGARFIGLCYLFSPGGAF